MFRRIATAALMCLASIADRAAVSAGEPAAGDPNQITNSIGMKLVRIAPGEFKMGSSESSESTAAFFNRFYGQHVMEAFSFNDEHPQHSVRITRAFYLGAYAVTRGEFRQFVAQANYKTEAERGKFGAVGWNSGKNEAELSKKYSWRSAGFEQTDEHPVVNVSWNDAAAFCKWLSGNEGKTYVLPTEAQWEYACRAGGATRYFFGDDTTKLGEYSWNGKNSGLKTHAVGKKKPNAWGLYDMNGNAGQWCQDWYDSGYYAKSPRDDPMGPATGSDRIIRGNSWCGLEFECRSAERSKWPNFSGATIGFRVSMVLAVKK